MSEKIERHHRERQAIVYVRQSSRQQVEHNQESQRRQLALVERAQALGWPEDRIRVIDTDLGCSGATAVGREGYRELVTAVIEERVGLVLALDATRLARDNALWATLLCECRLSQVLVADEHQVYDPNDRHDGLLLGLQGLMADLERQVLQERMQECWWQKARRGELYLNCPAGYTCHPQRGLEKHPNRRVQQVISLVLAEFERQPSMRQLCRWLREQDHRLPMTGSGRDPEDVSWKPANYWRVRELLTNPAYTGAYVLGRKRTVVERTPEGTQRRRVRVPQADWPIVIPDHHPAYLSQEQFERNQVKIAMNANRHGARVTGAARNGDSLLTGLVRCRRCQHKLRVRYSNGRARFYCTGGAAQHSGASGCFSFAAQRPEERLTEAVLSVVQPAGVAAAQAAEDLLRADQERRRQALDQAGEQLRYEVEHARRQYDRVDPDNRLVAAELEARWEQSLRTLQTHEAKASRLRQSWAQEVTPEQRAELQELGAHLERVWFHPQASMARKKELVRLLVKEVLADVDEENDEIVLLIHWHGGHHTELRASRRRGRPRSQQTDLTAVLGILRQVLSDASIAATLNRSHQPTENGETWTERRVAAFRKRHEIPAFDVQLKERQGWLTQAEAATRLKLSPMSVQRLVARGVLPAQQAGDGLPCVIQATDLDLPEVQRAVRLIKTNAKLPLPEHPDQPKLLI